jgi:hypothetical protein
MEWHLDALRIVASGSIAPGAGMPILRLPGPSLMPGRFDPNSLAGSAVRLDLPTAWTIAIFGAGSTIGDRQSDFGRILWLRLTLNER